MLTLPQLKQHDDAWIRYQKILIGAEIRVYRLKGRYSERFKAQIVQILYSVGCLMLCDVREGLCLSFKEPLRH